MQASRAGKRRRSERPGFRMAWLVVGLAAAVPAAAGPPPAEQYLLHCSGCHGPEGRGTPGTVPSLLDLGPVFKAEGGREYLARVPGVAQAPVSDADLAALLNWVLVTLSGVALDEPYAAGEVGELRARPLRDPAGARPEPAPRDVGITGM